MPFTCKVGDTLYLTDEQHRYVILTKLDNDNHVVATCFTSVKYWKECLVRFRPKHNTQLFRIPTTIAYGYSDFFSLDNLTEIAATPASDYVFCPESLVKPIIIGAFQSIHTPIGVLDELEIQYPDIAKIYYKIT